MRFIFALLASLVSVHAMAARLELTGPTLFYVSTVSGNDANDGLTPFTPKLTTNVMLAVLQASYDFKCNDVQVLHAVSATPYAPISINGSFVGQCGNPIRLVGSITLGAVTLNGLGGDGLQVAGADANVLIEGFSVQATGTGLHAFDGSSLYYRDIEFLNAQYHVSSEKRAKTYYSNKRSNNDPSNYNISGTAINHLYVNGNAVAFITETVNGHCINFTNPAVSFQVFANLIQGGNLTAHTNCITGVVNNYPALCVQWNSVGAYESQLPGNASTCVDANSAKIH